MTKRDIWEITSIGEWLERRRSDITASVVPALFDAHPFLSRAQLAAEKRGVSRGSNAAMKRGNRLEPAIIAAVQEEHPEWMVAKANHYYRMPAERLGATPDALGITDTGPLNVQCKSVSPQMWEEWGGRPPLAYTLQVATENLVVDAAHGVLAVMVCAGSYPIHYFDVPRHTMAEKRILGAVAEWWRAWDVDELAEGAPVAALATELDDGTHIDLMGDNELAVMLPERAQLKADVSIAEARLKEIDATIKSRIGAARTAWLPGWSISYETQHRKATVIAAKDIRVLRVRATEETAE